MSDLPPPPPGPPPGYQPDPYGYAQPGYVKVGPWLRFLGRLLDGLVLLVPNLVIGRLIDANTYSFGDADLDYGAFFIANVLSLALSLGYSVYFESTRGQTLGKMAIGARVVSPQGGNPTPEQALRRNIWAALALVPVLGGIAVAILQIVIAFQISSDPNGRGLHDNFAGGTMVTKVA